jgi:hypothetical protein
MKRFLVLASLTVGLVGVAIPPAQAGTTGQLKGTVHNESGEALPGVTVEAASPTQLGGAQVAVTDAAGNYWYSNLSPGIFTVKFDLEGFAPLEQTAVEVRLDGVTELHATLSSATVQETIVVTSEAPVVDPERVAVSTTYTQKYLDKAVIGSANRSYQAVLAQTAGVVGVGNPNVYGSTLGENAFYVDGLNTTDPVTATFGTNFNFDAIQEIDFKTAGFEAEYGNATGGLINLITKSGGNKFSGTFDARYRTNDFSESGDFFDAGATEVKFFTPGVTLGGPIQKDRIWFFTAYQYTDSRNTPERAPSTRTFESNYYLGKLSWRFNPSWQLVAKYSSDPADITNDNAGSDVLPAANSFQEQGGDILQADLAASFGANLLWNTRVGITRQELNAFPQGGRLDLAGHTDNNGVLPDSVNYTNAQFSKRDRDEVGSDLTWFVSALGDHQVKFGAGLADLAFSSENFTVSGYRYEDDGSDPFILWFEPNAGKADYEGSQTTFFVQDGWNPTSRLSLHPGLRYSQIDFQNDTGDTIADMSKLEPRAGLAWDVFGTGKTIVRGTWGRFLHPSALTLPNFAKQRSLPLFAYLSCSAFGFSRSRCQTSFPGAITAGGVTAQRWIDDPQRFDPNGYLLVAGNIFSSAPNEVVSDLDPTYADTLVVGIEHQLAPRTSIELSYVDKATKDIFEDTCDGNLNSRSEDASCDFYIMANLSELRRDYEGVILSFRSRGIERLNVQASYTYAKSKGSVEYTQNAGTDFDFFPVHFDNRYGYLSDDRRHRIKLNGYVELPAAFSLGFSSFWSSAFAYSRTTPADPYGSEFLSPRGAFRANDNYQVDLELRRAFQFGNFEAQAIASVFNVLDGERTTNVCNNSAGCAGGVEFGEPTSHQRPRNYELGVRLTF